MSVDHTAARIMLAYCAAFAFSIVLQFIAKLRAIRERFDKKKSLSKDEIASKVPYSRYESNHNLFLLQTDRAVGNYVEWSAQFLTLFWTSIHVGGDLPWIHSLGYVYVFSRFLYPIVAIRGGITFSGAKPIIFLATIPGYFVLLALAFEIYRKIV